MKAFSAAVLATFGSLFIKLASAKWYYNVRDEGNSCFMFEIFDDAIRESNGAEGFIIEDPVVCASCSGGSDCHWHFDSARYGGRGYFADVSKVASGDNQYNGMYHTDHGDFPFSFAFDQFHTAHGDM